MSVQNAGAAIREARLKAGLTQAQLAEGVCSVLSLSRIENGNAGVCPSTFQALMAHAGAATEAYPAFASYTDFDCFYRLRRALCYLDSWQLTYAFDELNEIEAMGWQTINSIIRNGCFCTVSCNFAPGAAVMTKFTIPCWRPFIFQTGF